MKYKVALVDDHVLFRMGIKSALASYKDIEIVFEANDGSEMLGYLLTQNVDVILLDLKMPNMSGFQTLRAIREKDEDVKILILSMYEDIEYITIMMESKANGYLLKNSKPEEIYSAVISCMMSDHNTNSTINKAFKKLQDVKKAKKEFTEREITILSLICKGKTTQEIADEFDLGTRAIESIKMKMLSRLGFNNTLQLILYAVKNNFVKLY